MSHLVLTSQGPAPTRSLNSGTRASALLLAVCAFSACAASRAVVLPPDLKEGVDRYIVAGRINLFTHRLTFGPYTASKVWIHGSSRGSGPTLRNGDPENLDERHRGSFDLATQAGTFHGQCDKLRVTLSKYGIVRGEDARLTVASLSYRCTLQQPSAAEVKFVFVDWEPGPTQVRGLELSFVPLGAESDRPRLAWGLSEGFVVLDGETPVAAVDLSDIDGSVTLSRALAPQRRVQVAALATGLLLLRDMH